MRVVFAAIDEVKNSFVWERTETDVERFLFDRMKAECEASDDEPHDLLADLHNSNGDIIDTVLMSRQVKNKALRILKPDA